MHNAASQGTPDAPTRVRPQPIGDRYGISKRVAAEWIRKMKAAGVVKKVGGILVARWSAIDEWVANGGEVPARRRGGSR